MKRKFLIGVGLLMFLAGSLFAPNALSECMDRTSFRCVKSSPFSPRYEMGIVADADCSCRRSLSGTGAELYCEGKVYEANGIVRHVEQVAYVDCYYGVMVD